MGRAGGTAVTDALRDLSATLAALVICAWLWAARSDLAVRLGLGVPR